VSIQFFLGQVQELTQDKNMSHFAKVENGKVVQVIVAEQDVIDSAIFGHGWVQTSYNTRGNVHYGQDGKPDGGVALRGNFAGIGYEYDDVNDVFIPPRTFPSWILSTQTFLWNAPIPCPQDGKPYTWNEQNRSWVVLE
jgi:hypothetical protein